MALPTAPTLTPNAARARLESCGNESGRPPGRCPETGRQLPVERKLPCKCPLQVSTNIIPLWRWENWGLGWFNLKPGLGIRLPVVKLMAVTLRRSCWKGLVLSPTQIINPESTREELGNTVFYSSSGDSNMQAVLRTLALSSRQAPVNNKFQATDSAGFNHCNRPAQRMEVAPHSSLYQPIFTAAVPGTSRDVADINKYLLNWVEIAPWMFTPILLPE